MAIEKIVKISVDQVQAAGGLEKFTQSLKETENKTQSLRAELRNLKEQMATLDEGSEQYQVIAKRAGEVSDKIADINTKVKNLGSDTKNIDSVVQGAQALSGAFSVASSASALLGTQNEDLQETMLKVESAIGLTVGIQSVANALQKESALVIGATSLATKIQIGVQTAWTAATTATTAATKALKVALISSGVGAIVVALGFLVAKLMESSDATADFKSEQDKLNASLERYNQLIADNLRMIDQEEKVAVLRAKIAGKTEADISKITKSFQQQRLQELKNDFDNKLKLEENYAKDLSKKLSSLSEEARTEALSKEAKLNEEVDKARESYFNQRKEIEVDGLEAELKVADDIREREKTAQEKAEAEAKRKREEAQKEREAARKKELEDYQEFLYNVEQADTNQYEIKAQTAKDEQERVDQAVNDAFAKMDGIYAADLEREKNLSDAKKKIKDEEIAAQKAHTDQAAGILDGFSELVGKHTAAGKAMAVATATINTFKGVSEVWGAASMGNPVVDMVIKIASTALVVASGIANVKKILSVKVPGNAGGGGGGISGGGVSAPVMPNFNIVGQNQNNQLAQTISNRQQQPVEAFVVSGNVTNAQSLDRNRVQTATFN